MSACVLLCTVGGSHQPILTAIEARQPRHVLFFCTGPDPATGQGGSEDMVLGAGTPILVRRGETAERLPNLPTLAGLADGQFEVCRVPPDDLDRAVALMQAAIARVRQRFPQADCVADYTGGTKTMTAALVMASLDSEGIALQLVTGARADLFQVLDGSQAGLAVSTDGIRLRRALAALLDAWRRHDYGAAAAGLKTLAPPRDPELRAELLVARGLSQALDAWDRFDYRRALEGLEPYRARVGVQHGRLFSALRWLTARDDPRRVPARLWDLWCNAERRASQGRHDDAAIRLHRLIEGTAHWLLTRADADRGADPGDRPAAPDAAPAAADAPAAPDAPRLQPHLPGPYQAWALAAQVLGGSVAAFWDAERQALLQHLRTWQTGILASGDRPLTRADWTAFRDWTERALLPLLREQAAAVGLRELAPQLPHTPLWRARSLSVEPQMCETDDSDAPPVG